ncbi:MAG TPA: SDR family NAD(P)-dependent oxidoreductase, partial [Anaerolineales bacterium]
MRGRTALVSGASRGIGRAIALALAEAGADVALTARNPSDLELVAGQV